jgi:uroporphyrinogen decarboxylase
MDSIGHKGSQGVDDKRRCRLISALNHQEPDRYPLTIGSPSCSLHATTHANLLDHLGHPLSDSPRITDNILQIVETDQRLIDTFEIDMRWVLPDESKVEWSDDKTNFTDNLGRRYMAGGGFFNQVGFPLKDISEEKLKTYKFPELSTDRFDHLGDQARDLYKQGYGLGIDGPWGLYEISSSLVGVSKFLMDLILNPGLARKVAERVLEEHLIPFYDRLLENTHEFVQVVGISDDLGAQNGLIFSPKIYRDLFKPLHKRLIAQIHKKTSAKVYMHSDGSIHPLLPDLIEIGVEGLNPVQYTAKDMELDRLKMEFGQDLGFFGGVVENAVLSFHSPQEIRSLVKENVSILKRDGGFIFAPIHNISQEVPPENIIALYEAGLEFGGN